MCAILRGSPPKHQSASAPAGLVDRARVQLCAIAFEALYGPGARIYDRFTDWLFAGEWRRWQETIVPFLPDRGVVVELGSGTGALASRHATADRRWIAVERSPAMLAVARRTLRGSSARLVRADARALPLAEHTVDLVIATFPAAFILDPRTWEEIERVLVPGGRYAIVATGHLRSIDAATHWRRALLAIAYGKRGDEADPIGIDGIPPANLPGEWKWLPTARGEALVATGTRPTGISTNSPATEEPADQELAARRPTL